MIHVDILKPNVKSLKPFVQLPFDIYMDDEYWVPPVRRDLLCTLTGQENDLFAQGIQRFFLAYDNEKPVARVLAGIALRQHGPSGDPLGYISLFETYDDYEYARAVLDAAMGFLRDHGAKEVLGPLSPRYDMLSAGVLVDGFDGPPVLESPYNQPWLPQMLERYGFAKHRDYLAYDIPIAEIPVDRIIAMGDRIRKRFGVVIEHVDFARGNLARVAQDISTIICEAMPEETGTMLPTPEDLLQLFKRIRPYLRRETAVVAYAGSRPIGCVIGFLDSTPSLMGTDGRRTPWNWLKRVITLGRTTSSRCPMQFVVPDYQNMAVNALMLAETVKGAMSLGIRRVEGSPVDETHQVSVNNTRMAGGQHYRTYRVYRIRLAEAHGSGEKGKKN
ncbi:MAG: hypothetical protein PHP02_08600 [Eubacteriales bacterium]|nr:hypothetical protein [Eubacteriales bacterium]